MRQIEFPNPQNQVVFLNADEARIVVTKALTSNKNVKYTKKRLMGLLRITTLNRHARKYPEDTHYTLLYIRDVESFKAQDKHNEKILLTLHRDGLFEYEAEKVQYVRGRKSYPFYIAKLKK